MPLLDNTGVYTTGVVGKVMAATASLTSTAPNRKIEISINGGLNYTTVQYDMETTDCLGVVIRAPISHIRFTGAQGDRWEYMA